MTHTFTGPVRASYDELVIHETVTRSAAAAIRVLRKRGLSIHDVCDEHGAILLHADPLVVCQHAGRAHNRFARGIEVVNPYYPKHLRPGLPWGRTIAAPWAHGGRYVLPTPAQAEAVAQYIAALTPNPVPRVWAGLSGGRMAMGRVARAQRHCPGILAHTYFGHADGAWLVLYAFIRIECGRSPEAAYSLAIARATDRKWADVSDLLPQRAA